jgi:NADH-quinone oxidoreductase subunit E
MLHLVQSEEGYVSPDGIALCAELLGLTTAEVAAVATFYTQFKRHPNGTYTVGVCTNTLCAVMGGDAIWESLQAYLGVGHDETTDDGAITLERVECNAGCDYAPVMMVNWEFFDNQTPSSAKAVVDRLRAGQPVAPTRGASSVCTFKEMSRVLAGFLDEHANEGVGAGPATLQGTLLARREGWSAPPLNGSNGAGRGVPTEAVGAQQTAAGGASSAHDAPAVAPDSDRGGTVAGKPAGAATVGEGDSGTGTTPPATGGTSQEG